MHIMLMKSDGRIGSDGHRSAMTRASQLRLRLPSVGSRWRFDSKSRAESPSQSTAYKRPAGRSEWHGRLKRNVMGQRTEGIEIVHAQAWSVARAATIIYVRFAGKKPPKLEDDALS